MDIRRVLVPSVLVSSVAALAMACGSSGSGATASDEPLGCTGLEAPESGMVDLAGRPGAIVHVPESYDPTVAAPLVLVFHGANVSPAAIEKLTGFSDVSDAEGFLAVYPSGQEEITPQPGRGWSPARTRDGVDLSDRQRDLPDWLLTGLVDGNPDLAYVDALLTELDSRFCIDTRRVYAAGHSMGGGFVLALACTHADRFAAVGVVAGAFVEDAGECEPARPVPVMGFAYADDPLVPFDGGPSMGVELMPFEQLGEVLAEANDCRWARANAGPEDSELKEWSGCSARVIMWTLPGRIHSWPKDLNGVHATLLLWDFFADQPMA